MRLIVKLFTALALVFLASNLFAFGRASHVVVIVWDGMRPDFVSEETTPTLIRLARQGVTFRNHHPVYLSTTEVNGTALATGVYPGESGIIANKEFRPAINAWKKIQTESLAAIRHSDDALAHLLAALDQRGLGKETDFIVVSDHGFSTIEENADVAETLNSHGFHACRTLPQVGPREGDVMVVGNGGSAFLYVTGHQASRVERIVHCIQAQPFCGVVFTRTPVEGAFRLHDVRLDSSFAPDIVLSMRWKPDKSTNGTAGLICSDYGQYGPGQGMHGSLSPFDMHNLCVAAGPDFRKGVEDDIPSGNLDLAPTVLWILGIKPERKPSGRVLTEAMTEGDDTRPPRETHQLEATCRTGGVVWRQYLKYSQVGGVLYFEEGNGEQVSRKDVVGNCLPPAAAAYLGGNYLAAVGNVEAPARASGHLLAQPSTQLEPCRGLRRARHFTSRKNCALAATGA